jgi:hypothetical protein
VKINQLVKVLWGCGGIKIREGVVCVVVGGWFVLLVVFGFSLCSF